MTNTYNEFYNYLLDNDVITLDDFSEMIVDGLIHDDISLEAFEEASSYEMFRRGERLAPPIDMEPDIFQMLIREELSGMGHLHGVLVGDIIQEMTLTRCFHPAIIQSLKAEHNRQLDIHHDS